MTVAIAAISALWRYRGVLSAADSVSLGWKYLVDEVCEHLVHQVWGGLGEQFFQILGRVDMMRGSGHRGYIPFEDR